MNKPTVHYDADGIAEIAVGERATVNVIDHYNEWLYHGQMVFTSTVLNYDTETGVFETKNSVYVPMKLDN